MLLQCLWFTIAIAVDSFQTIVDVNEGVSLLQHRMSKIHNDKASDFFPPLDSGEVLAVGGGGEDALNVQHGRQRLFFPASRTQFPEHKIAFLGDSLTSGMADLCDESDASVAFPAVSCAMLDAECYVFADAGIGMYRSTGRDNTAPMLWDQLSGVSGGQLISWIPDAVVVNVGVNDDVQNPSDPCCKKFRGAYKKWLIHANSQYNSMPTFFLACGPTHTDYCRDVKIVVRKAQRKGIKAVYVEMTDDNSTRATECMNHPGVEGHKYLADKLVETIKEEMGWHSH